MPYPSKTDRNIILATAMEHVALNGHETLAIRSVATSLGLAPNALYRYFPSLAALESAIAEESRRRLFEVLQKAAEKKSAERAIKGIARAYLSFARENPKIFLLTLLPSDSDEQTHLRTWELVLSHVASIYGAEKAPRAAVALWAFLHGMTVLEAAGIFSDTKPANSFEFGLNMWVEAAKA